MHGSTHGSWPRTETCGMAQAVKDYEWISIWGEEGYGTTKWDACALCVDAKVHWIS